jgi:DNA-binding MarR family transcriptional regulator
MTNTHGLYSGQLADLVNRLGRAAHCLQFSEGLNPAQWEALRYLARANRVSRSPTALANYLGTTKGTASQTLRALEAKGYVRRTRGAADRRSVALDLTPAGEKVLEADPIARIEQLAGQIPEELGAAMADGLTSLLGDLRAGCGSAMFGVCAQCGHHLAERETAERRDRCGLSGEILTVEDDKLICVDFAPRPA